MANRWADDYLTSLSPDAFPPKAPENEFEDLEDPMLELFLLWHSNSVVECLRVAFAALQRCPENAPPDLVAMLIESVEYCERAITDRQAQLPGLRARTEAEPDNGEAQAALAFVLSALDHREEAVDLYRRALQNSSSLCFLCHRDCINNLGWDCLLQQKCDDALVWFEQACWLRPSTDFKSHVEGAVDEVAPPYRLALENVLLCLAKLGRLSEAAKRLVVYFDHFGRLPRYESEALRKLGLDSDVAYIRATIESRRKARSGEA